MATSYQKTKFSKTKGALAYYNELKHLASRMVQPPDKYSMKRKFLGGLPNDLIENLFKSRHVTVEHTPIDKLLREVKLWKARYKLSKTIEAIDWLLLNRIAVLLLMSRILKRVTMTLVWFIL